MASSSRHLSLRRLFSRRLTQGAPAVLVRFGGDRRAVGAVEFALIAPFLLTLYLGGTQLSMALTAHRKVQHIASTVNDLVTQDSSLTAAQLNGIFNIAEAIITPYDVSKLGIKVTAVAIDENGVQKTAWSCRFGAMPASAVGTPFPLPDKLASLRSKQIIVTETSYDFQPVAGYFADEGFEMGGTSYLNPRNADTIDSRGC